MRVAAVARCFNGSLLVSEDPERVGGGDGRDGARERQIDGGGGRDKVLLLRVLLRACIAGTQSHTHYCGRDCVRLRAGALGGRWYNIIHTYHVYHII
jgi:hypothetical protein